MCRLHVLHGDEQECVQEVLEELQGQVPESEGRGHRDCQGKEEDEQEGCRDPETVRRGEADIRGIGHRVWNIKTESCPDRE